MPLKISVISIMIDLLIINIDCMLPWLHVYHAHTFISGLNIQLNAQLESANGDLFYGHLVQ